MNDSKPTVTKARTVNWNTIGLRLLVVSVVAATMNAFVDFPEPIQSRSAEFKRWLMQSIQISGLHDGYQRALEKFSEWAIFAKMHSADTFKHALTKTSLLLGGFKAAWPSYVIPAPSINVTDGPCSSQAGSNDNAARLFDALAGDHVTRNLQAVRAALRDTSWEVLTLAGIVIVIALGQLVGRCRRGKTRKMSARAQVDRAVPAVKSAPRTQESSRDRQGPGTSAASLATVPSSALSATSDDEGIGYDAHNVADNEDFVASAAPSLPRERWVSASHAQVKPRVPLFSLPPDGSSPPHALQRAGAALVRGDSCSSTRSSSRTVSFDVRGGELPREGRDERSAQRSGRSDRGDSGGGFRDRTDVARRQHGRASSVGSRRSSVTSGSAASVPSVHGRNHVSQPTNMIGGDARYDQTRQERAITHGRANNHAPPMHTYAPSASSASAFHGIVSPSASTASRTPVLSGHGPSGGSIGSHHLSPASLGGPQAGSASVASPASGSGSLLQHHLETSSVASLVSGEAAGMPPHMAAELGRMRAAAQAARSAARGRARAEMAQSVAAAAGVSLDDPLVASVLARTL